MSIDYRQIRQSLRKRLLTVQSLPQIIVYENRGITPPEDAALWIGEHFMPITEAHIASNQLQSTGLLKINVFTRKGGGTEAVEDMADRIKKKFEPPLAISSTIAVDRAERSAALSDDTWYWVPVDIFWRAYGTAAN